MDSVDLTNIFEKINQSTVQKPSPSKNISSLFPRCCGDFVDSKSNHLDECYKETLQYFRRQNELEHLSQKEYIEAWTLHPRTAWKVLRNSNIFSIFGNTFIAISC